MLNIFNMFAKKSADGAVAQEKKPVFEEKPIKLDNIEVHVMPERFRNQPAKLNSAKTTGLVIIAGGVVFLIVASVMLYLFLFKQPAVPLATGVNQTAQGNQAENAPEENQPIVPPENAAAPATTTETATLPTDASSLASSTALTAPESIEQVETAGIKPGQDSDLDGLTDVEEAILGTSTSTPDTDRDGYLDGSETVNLYDPASAGKLVTNPNIAVYDNKTFNYSVLYPKVWEISANGGDDSIMFKSPDNQFLQIIVQPNPTKQTLEQWYLEQLGLSVISQQDRVSGAGWQGIINPDGQTLYSIDAKQNYIYTLTYNLGGSNVLEYPNIFQVMIKSFTLKN